jgi:hypothetical protein
MITGTSNIGRMSGLLSEGLRVRQISNFSLATCESKDDTGEILKRPSLVDFDQIPIREGNRIVGILERKEKRRRVLDDSLLVSADEHLSRFIFTLKNQPYRLVVDGTSISGIVTWSDLQKTPVLLFGYALIADIELQMNRAIQIKYGDSDEWVNELSDEEKKKIEYQKKKQRKNNLILPTVDLADFSHKAKVICTQFLSGFDFDSDLKKLVDLRNDVAHVHKVVRNAEDLHRFVGDLETATAWNDALYKSISLRINATTNEVTGAPV